MWIWKHQHTLTLHLCHNLIPTDTGVTLLLPRLFDLKDTWINLHCEPVLPVCWISTAVTYLWLLPGATECDKVHCSDTMWWLKKHIVYLVMVWMPHLLTAFELHHRESCCKDCKILCISCENGRQPVNQLKSSTHRYNTLSHSKVSLSPLELAHCEILLYWTTRHNLYCQLYHKRLNLYYWFKIHIFSTLFHSV